MQRDQMLQRAREAALRARPLLSGFNVGACGAFSTGEIFEGANIEGGFKTAIGICAERALLAGANSTIGPLSSDGGRDGRPVWQRMAIWGPTKQPITPCGICRDALAATGTPDSLLFSRGPNGQVLEVAISDLLPVPGHGPNGEAAAEVERLSLQGGVIHQELTAACSALLDRCRVAADRSYIPPFVKEPRAGAAIEMANGEVVFGCVTIDATTQLGGSAIASAARRALERVNGAAKTALRIALFTDSPVLRAPSGSDLQLLYEVASVDACIVFGCNDSRAYQSTLATLLPRAFSKSDLGY